MIGSPLEAKLLEPFAKLPATFEPCVGTNCGREARYLSRGSGYTLFLMAGAAVMNLHGSSVERPGDAVLRMTFPGARQDANPAGVGLLPGTVNYLTGNDPQRWRTNIPTYGRVTYREIYQGVDLVFYGSQDQLEFDFELSPGADPRQIRLAFEGARKIELDSQGTIRLQTPAGQVQLRQPLVYQRRDHGGRLEVPARYVLRGTREVGFDVNPYDPAAPLTIDPILVYSTYLGPRSGDNEFGSGIAVDSARNVYITGVTRSVDFPTSTGAFQSSVRGVDAFVAKLNPAGTALIYSTFLGGGNFDEGVAIKVDPAGNAYLTGRTFSTDFPTTAGALQREFGGGTSDVFITKLNATGTGLVYSTYLGGRSVDRPYGIAIDPGGNAYVAGQTLSANYPVTASALQRELRGEMDAFISKIDPAGTSLVYSTFLGGGDADVAFGIALDASGQSYVTGITRSGITFPATPGAFRSAIGDSAVFVAKVNLAGAALVYSSVFGSGSGSGIAVDDAGSAYVTGHGRVPATPGAAFETAHDTDEAFVAKLNPAGTGLAYATYLGGSSGEAGTAIAVDATGNAYVAGYTESHDFPTTADAVQICEQGQLDVFVTKVNPSGMGLLWSSYLGGAVSDWANAIAIDAEENIYLTGYAGGNPFPELQPDFPTTPGSFLPTGGGAFVTKINLGPAPDRAAPMISGVVSGATFGCQIQRNSWITIRGSNLAATTRIWTEQDIVNGILPTSLDGVSVTVKGTPAAVYYVSPTQINALAPAGQTVSPGEGRVVISVTNSNGTARFFNDFWPSAPGWFTFAPQNGRYLAATLPDGTYLGPPGLFGTAIATRPAKPGDVAVLYGTGFGDSNPPAPSDRVFTTAFPLADPVITIGGVPARVLFSGMVSPGLCQFNVVIPEVADGDREVRAIVQEHYPTQSAFLNIRR